MSVETWKSIADWATIVFIAFTVVSGSAALILGDRINEKQIEQLQKFDRDLTGAKSGLSVQQQRAAEAEKQLELVKQGTTHAQNDAASANQRAAEASQKAEELRVQRLELEKTLAPREMFVGIINGISSSDPLKTSGITCAIETIADEEAKRAAGNIAGTVHGAGWTVSGLEITYGGNFRDGVTIWYRKYVGVPGPNAAADKSEHAAVLLTAFLLAHDWKGIRLEWVDANKASVSSPERPAIAMNAIVVRVGFKPNPYFRDPALEVNPMYSYLENLLEIRRLTTEMRNHKEQLETALEKMRPELLKRNQAAERQFEDAMKHLEEIKRQEEEFNRRLPPPPPK